MSENRKLAAILCSDVVGYSRLAGADEDRILARLRALRSDLIDPTIAVHHGRVVKRTGDGAIVEFRSVVDAVRCAIEIQNAMVERNAGVPEDRRIVFRIGIHIGDVVEESDGDLMGDGVNIAARLEGVAKPGAICLSEDAYRQVSGRLDMLVTDLGPTQLKNIERSIRVYSLQVGVPALAKPAIEVKVVEPKRRSLLAPLVMAIVALIVIGTGVGYLVFANRTMPVASNAAVPVASAHLSVVVLPFANLSGDLAQDYLADALTDEVTTAIARLRDTFVIARNTAFTYKGKPVDAKAIGKELGVRYVFEGSVQPSGDQVRVNAQLIDADSGAHLWAEQFDTPRADLLKMQDEIVTRLALAMAIRLPEAEGARLKRTPAANPDAQVLALQCSSAAIKSAYHVTEDFRLCEQALAIDPNNVRALGYLAVRYYVPVYLGLSADPKADLKRADELNSRALALDPNWSNLHLSKANILNIQGRYDEAIGESERALALDPATDYADANLAWDHAQLGQFEKALEYDDKAIRLSPHDPYLFGWLDSKSQCYIGLKQYDQAIDLARQSLSLSPNLPSAHSHLIAALALSGRDAEAREALQRFLALPPAGLGTIAAWQAFKAQNINEHSDPRILDYWGRVIDGLRKAGMPEDDKPRLSIVVLPFTNLSGDSAQDYLADALTGELTTGLARLHDTFVIARNTASTYKGKPIDAKAIGRDLGVRYALEGSVQPSGAQVRVNAQLVDAESGVNLWAEQFDTPRADLLQMQDEIVAHLARAMDIQLRYVEAARLKRTPVANPDAEDLALQCQAGVQKGGYIGKVADEGYRLCEQALAADPNNALALTMLSIKFWLPVAQGRSADPKADLERADELNSHALAVDPNLAGAHAEMGNILGTEGRRDEAIAENERALALDPAMVDGYSNLGFDYLNLGQFEKSLEFLDKAIQLSPHDPNPGYWSGGKAEDYFALKRYDEAIEWARRSIAINPSNPFVHGALVAALTLTGHEAEAHDALQRYLALPSIGPKTIAAWKASKAQLTNERSDPRYLEYWDRVIEGLRKAGMPEDDKPKLSIVVLPFSNLSGDASQDYLADALTDEVTTALARIRDSFVIARNTAYTYKGKGADAKAIGKELGVRYVLEGSMQAGAAQVRINAQLIDADSGGNLWAEQFDTARADLLQMQDEIVTHLARAMDLQLTEAEAARLKRAPPANPKAEDLALQCVAGLRKGGYIGKEADSAYGLCEQALAVDPDNVLATNFFAIKTWVPASSGLSADPKGDLKRADEVVSRALAQNPNDHYLLGSKGHILMFEAHYDEAIAEHERSLALDPADADVVVGLAFDYLYLGQFQKSLELFDKTIRLSPLDPAQLFWYTGKSAAYFGLSQYDEAIGSARRAIAINPNYVPAAYANLVAALALTGRDPESREALQSFLALPSSGQLRTIAAWEAYFATKVDDQHRDPRVLEAYARTIEGLRKAGMPKA